MPVRATTKMGVSETGVLRRVAAIVLLVCGILNLSAAAWAILARPALNTDFMAFWSFPRFVAAGNVMGIYDAQLLQSFQSRLYPGFHSFYPFLYPPTWLVATFWLKFFSFAAAQVIWTVAGISLLAAAGWWFFPARWRVIAILAMLASPACLLNGMTGETGYFTSALLLAGFAALPARKTLAGLAFGLLTLKPQLGLLVPFFLLARGEWRVILVAGAVAVGLIAASCVIFPLGLWGEWAHTLPGYQHAYFAAGGSLNLNIIVTVSANLVTLGAGAGFAWGAQAASFVAVAICVVWAARAAPYPLAVALLWTGIFLAAPHAYAYDSVILSVVLVVLAASSRSALFTILALVIYLAPLMLLTSLSHWFLYALPEAALFAFALRTALQVPPQAADQSHRRLQNTY
jgi:hypothetical protein